MRNIKSGTLILPVMPLFLCSLSSRTSSHNVSPDATMFSASLFVTQLNIGSFNRELKSSFDRRINEPSVSIMIFALRLASDNRASSPKASPSFNVASVNCVLDLDVRVTLKDGDAFGEEALL